jgi:DNA-binding CsgD family transcriptional regulator
MLEHAVAVHVGGLCDVAGNDIATLSSDPQLAGARAVVAANVALAHADAGRGRDALETVTLAETWARTPAETAVVMWARSECELQAGRVRRRAASAETACAQSPLQLPVASLAQVTRAWAAWFEGDDVHASPEVPFAPAAGELEALQCLAAERWRDAADAFEQAASGWLGRQRRASLRCTWAAGEAARLAGERERAIALLEQAERESELLGHRPLVARARASLRQAGVRRAPSRRGARVDDLSAREHEVMTMVAMGKTSREIATDFGVAASTVDSQIETAMRKLGARTRRQAAAMMTEHADV